MSQEKQFQKYHRVLNRVKWSALAASRRLLGLLVEVFAPQGPLLMALDDTIERRRGAKIAARSIYRDPVRSSHSHFVKANGLPVVPLRGVMVHDPLNTFKTQALLCTDEAVGPE